MNSLIMMFYLTTQSMNSKMHLLDFLRYKTPKTGQEAASVRVSLTSSWFCSPTSGNLRTWAKSSSSTTRYWLMRKWLRSMIRSRLTWTYTSRKKMSSASSTTSRKTIRLSVTLLCKCSNWIWIIWRGRTSWTIFCTACSTTSSQRMHTPGWFYSTSACSVRNWALLIKNYSMIHAKIGTNSSTDHVKLW